MFNLEMQTTNNHELAHRSRYYQSIIDLNNVDKGHSYNELKDSYIIFICTFDPFGKRLPCYTFENICKEKPELALEDGTQKLFFNTKASALAHNADLRTFLRYVAGECVEEKNDIIQEIATEVEHIKRSDELKVEYMTLYDMKREERQIGWQLGRQEGRQEGLVETIRNALAYCNDELIVKITGASLEEVQRLRRKYHGS